MAVFNYRALAVDRSPIRGTLIADTPRQARDTLRERGLMIQEVSPAQETSKRSGIASMLNDWLDRRQSAHVVVFIRELATLLGVGTPLLEAIDTVVKQQRKNRFRGVLIEMRDRISQGLSLSEAMRLRPNVFDTLTVSMVEVGESSGSLSEVLEHLAAYRESAEQLKGKIGTALIYPLIVLTVGLIVAVFLMTFVVPQLLESLIEAGQTLPLSTRVVKTVSDVILGGWWFILPGVLLAIAVIGWIGSTTRGRRSWAVGVLRLPIFGELVRKQASSRIALLLGVMLRGGMAFVPAIRIVRDGTANPVFREALTRCETAVTSGRDIAEALDHTDAFPPTLIQVFSIGQRSGRLVEMLDRLARDYDRAVSLASGRLTAALEPIMILLLAAFVGFIAFATILPILQAGNVLTY